MKELAKTTLQKLGLYQWLKPHLDERWIKNEQKKKEQAFRKEFEDFESLSRSTQARFSLNWEKRLPCLDDKTNVTPIDKHYIYHPAWAARILHETRPYSHVDISSILHFSTIVSAFIPVKFYDYRPAGLNLSGLTSGTADLTQLPFESDSIESISCMHTIEHIGLGRYGDPLDYDGDLKAIHELKRVTAKGGNLLLVVPVGKPVILFNGNRIYSYKQIKSYFTGFDLVDFSLIPDHEKEGGIIPNATEQMADDQDYGCGCFWFRKNK